MTEDDGYTTAYESGGESNAIIKTMWAWHDESRTLSWSRSLPQDTFDGGHRQHHLPSAPVVSYTHVAAVCFSASGKRLEVPIQPIGTNGSLIFRACTTHPTQEL